MPSWEDRKSARASPRVVADPPPPKNLFELVRLIEAPSANAPFPIEAIGLEEDTSLVLSADIEVRDPGQHPIRLMTELCADQSQLPGGVVAKKGNPIRLLAIVHDFDQRPSWREEWIRSCLDQIFEHCDKQQFVALGLEPLETKHGRVPREKFKELLHASLRAAPPSSLRRIWLIES